MTEINLVSTLRIIDDMLCLNVNQVQPAKQQHKLKIW